MVYVHIKVYLFVGIGLLYYYLSERTEPTTENSWLFYLLVIWLFGLVAHVIYVWYRSGDRHEVDGFIY